MKVLLGVGGSDDAILALERTLDRAESAGDDLTVAVVENTAVEAAPEDVAARVREALSGRGLDAEVRIVEGEPGPSLVALAETEGYDEIVLGGGEESPMGKITVGDIAEFVVLNATVTVTLVR